MLLLIDNFDSFVYNLARYFNELGVETRVARNDAISVPEIAAMVPRAIVISPGPCAPRDAGISLEVIRRLGPSIPMLGVCLGHQALAEACGGRVVRAREPVHGRTARILHHGEGVFAGLPNPLTATRYHSLIAEEATLPAELKVVARTEDGVPMALEHVIWPAYGVQFHPESILTEGGHQLLANFLQIAGISSKAAPVGDLPPAISDPPPPPGQVLYW